ncbi:MAG: hypothetical protein WKF75_06665 [Singulisphaera sp.]
MSIRPRRLSSSLLLILGGRWAGLLGLDPLVRAGGGDRSTNRS